MTTDALEALTREVLNLPTFGILSRVIFNPRDVLGDSHPLFTRIMIAFRAGDGRWVIQVMEYGIENERYQGAEGFEYIDPFDQAGWKRNPRTEDQLREAMFEVFAHAIQKRADMIHLRNTYDPKSPEGRAAATARAWDLTGSGANS